MAKNTTQTDAYKRSSGTSGYSQIPSPGAPTYTEAWALIEAARRMASAIELYAQSENPASPKTREILREPVRLNWRLWTIFQAELINGMDDPNNPMSSDLRTNMLTLCQFVDKHTTQTLADPVPERLIILIDLNRNIASGLLETPHAPDTGETAPSSTAPQKPHAPESHSDSASTIGKSFSQDA